MISRGFFAPRRPPWLLLPALGWFFGFILIPLSIIFVYSFSTKGPYGGVVFHFNLDNYYRTADWIYLKIFWNSFKLASITAFCCLVLGYPMAYVMATASARMRSVLLVLVIVPFWTNFVVRAYATKILFGEYGPINHFALRMGLIHEPILFLNSSFSLWLGMITNYLPFMVLPLYVALEKFDFSLLEAAKDLGASSSKVLFKILVPLTRQGIVSGVIFVFTPALGEFVIPDLLGGARSMLIGNLITEQFLKTRDWPFGAALSLFLMILVMGCLWIYLRIQSSEEGVGYIMAFESQVRPRSSHLARAMTLLGFLVLYIPLVSLIFFSFLTHNIQPGGVREWTFEWYQKLALNAPVLDSFKMSVFVGLWTTFFSTLTGTMAALALARQKFFGKKIFNALTYVPLIIPEIVLGLSLLVWFVFLKLTLGLFSIVLAHITFSISYVIITVKARLHGFDRSLEEAAKDLGASQWNIFWKVTFPLIWPAILSGALMAFTLSFDDFLITFFTSGVGSDTLPLKIYSMIKFGVTPEINALSALMLGVTFLVVIVFFTSQKNSSPPSI